MIETLRCPHNFQLKVGRFVVAQLCSSAFGVIRRFEVYARRL